SEVIEKAKMLNLMLFQCFLFDQENCKYFKVTPELKKNFSDAQDLFLKRYVHGSYYINLADPSRDYQLLLKKELSLAKKLGFNMYILHPGAVPKNYTRQTGINSIASFLNKACKEFQDIIFILENIPHGNRSIGGNLQDIYDIITKIEYPERVKVCLDTVHAYVYGYNIRTEEGRADFINQAKLLFTENFIELIHLNDTQELCACQKDSHALIGEGVLSNLPDNALKELINNNFFKDKPKIIEAPKVSIEKEQAAINIAKTWLL
ncbi:MAG: deoxyribonuclease IV, partial [Candidatus Amoebophilus sp.]